MTVIKPTVECNENFMTVIKPTVGGVVLYKPGSNDHMTPDAGGYCCWTPYQLGQGACSLAAEEAAAPK